MDIWWVFDAAFEDVFVDFHGRAAVPEGGEAAEHFEDEDAKGPPVYNHVSSHKERWFERQWQDDGSGDIPVNGFVVAL